jgi:Ca-activated chloride channel family protein
MRKLATVVLAAFCAIPARGDEAKRFTSPFTAYSAGAYDEALRLFLDAQVDHPKDPRVAYNIGNSYYKKGDFAAAAQAYTQALAAKDPQLRAHATYNLGNALVRQQKLEEAAQAYEKALALEPQDDDARYNLEVVRRLMQERRQPSAESQQQNQKKDPKRDEKQGRQQASQDSQDRQQTSQQEQANKQQARDTAREQQQAGSKAQEQKPAAASDERSLRDAGSPPESGKSQTRGTPASSQKADAAGDQKAAEAGAARAGTARKLEGEGLSREEAERYLRQLGDTRPKAPHNQRGGSSVPPAKDW